MTFAELIKKRRNDLAITQAELAEKLGYTSPQFISNWERNKARPPRETFQPLSRVLKVPLSKLAAIELNEWLSKQKKDLGM